MGHKKRRKQKQGNKKPGKSYATPNCSKGQKRELRLDIDAGVEHFRLSSYDRYLGGGHTYDPGTMKHIDASPPSSSKPAYKA